MNYLEQNFSQNVSLDDCIYVVGCMSGTSLDGLDIALCSFYQDNEAKWQYHIKLATTLPYSKSWYQKLTNAHKLNALEFVQLHKDYGTYIGESVYLFLLQHKLTAHYISSHGHTIFHNPANRITFQIGDGASIAATSGINTICDFRSLDVALGGEGAPLVPIGDELLFYDFDFCLNLGGFSNISLLKDDKRIAFDICPVNIICNIIAHKLGIDYDKDGLIGQQGTVHIPLLESLNNITFYNRQPPKSLGREWLEKYFIPVLERFKLSHSDQLRTLYEHIAQQITLNTNNFRQGKILITGGGAFNRFLIERIKAHTKHKIVIPDHNIVTYKEALIFAFLGLLRIRNENNCLKSVTGATHDNVGGCVYVSNTKKY